MKRYAEYMDKIDAPEELTEKLLDLTARKKPVRIYRWAAAAAALILAIGAGAAWRYAPRRENQSLSAGDATDDTSGDTSGDTTGDTAGSTAPNIIVDSPAGVLEFSGELGYENLPDHGGSYTEPIRLPSVDDPGDVLSLGGYDIVDGQVITRYILPGLNFGHAEMMASADYSLGDTWRDAGPEEVEAILTPLWREHLGIPEETGSETFTIYEKNGSVNGFQLTVSWEGNSIDMEQQIGYNVPTCCVPPDDAYGHTDVDGVDVVTLTWCGDGPDGADDHCEVKFLVNGTGWKATIAGENYRELASRFVRLGICEPNTGLAAAFSIDANDPGDAPGEINEMITPGYDPNAE